MGFFSKKKNNVVVHDIKVTRPKDEGTPPPTIKNPMPKSSSLQPKPKSKEKESIQSNKTTDNMQSKKKEGTSLTGRTQYSTETSHDGESSKKSEVESGEEVESRTPEINEGKERQQSVQLKEDRQNVSGDDDGSDLDDENSESNDDGSYVSGDDTATLSVLKILEDESAQESTTTPSVQGTNQTTANHMYEEADKL